jgi:hypothetical protein
MKSLLSQKMQRFYINMLSHEEEHEIRLEEFYRKYGHYPDETPCSYCGQTQKTNTMAQMKDIFTEPFLSTLPPHWVYWLLCVNCSGRSKKSSSNVRKGFSKSTGGSDKPVQLSLEFPDINSSSISKSRS